MSKVLTEPELLDIISRVIAGEMKLTPGKYQDFLDSLAEAITDTFGGTSSYPDYIDDGLGYTIAISIDDRVPADGGIYAKYDTDVTWKDGKEEELGTDECSGCINAGETTCCGGDPAFCHSSKEGGE